MGLPRAAAPTTDRVTDAWAIARALAESDPLRFGPSDDDLRCVYCGAPAQRTPGTKRGTRAVAWSYVGLHTATCLWWRARRWADALAVTA